MVGVVMMARQLLVEGLIPLVGARVQAIEVELIKVLIVRAILISEVCCINWLHGLQVCLPEVYMC